MIWDDAPGIVATQGAVCLCRNGWGGTCKHFRRGSSWFLLALAICWMPEASHATLIADYGTVLLTDATNPNARATVHTTYWHDRQEAPNLYAYFYEVRNASIGPQSPVPAAPRNVKPDGSPWQSPHRPTISEVRIEVNPQAGFTKKLDSDAPGVFPPYIAAYLPPPTGWDFQVWDNSEANLTGYSLRWTSSLKFYDLFQDPVAGDSSLMTNLIVFGIYSANSAIPAGGGASFGSPPGLFTSFRIQFEDPSGVATGLAVPEPSTLFL